ncbi:GNAT family N-acetyltransferase [Ectobacillus panaciterrae]|uniref:GNAT family N-acetyltransferase n=1 Tax=Ectobacillus panaciterrae TaxID=363872 RepID=UPI00041592AE|nr:GNAT family N-acetyltransferase [Ectobacillus panaciterrae]
MQITTNRLIILPCTRDLVKEKDYEAGDHIMMYLKELRQNPDMSGWGVWYVMEKETNRVVGDLGFKGKPNEEREVEIGYGILPAVQKKGYATEAVTALVTWAFGTEKVSTVLAECLETNAASIRVLEKAGFTKTGKRHEMIDWRKENRETQKTH